MNFTKKITALLKKEVECCILKLQEGGKIDRNENMEYLMKICFESVDKKALKLKAKEDEKAVKLKEKEEEKAAKLKAKEEAKALKLKAKEEAKAAKLKAKEEEKAAKEEEKAAKLKEKEEAKLLKKKAKEEAKAAKLKEKEEAKAAKLKEKEEAKAKLTVEETVNELVEESMSDDDDDDEGTQVMKFEHKSRPGETLWVDEDKHIFDNDQEHIGNYDEELDVIYEVEE